MRISVACGVEKMLKPGTAGNSVSVEPVGFGLHEFCVQCRRNLRSGSAARDAQLDSVAQFFAFVSKFRNSGAERREVEMLLDVAPFVQLRGEMIQCRAVESEIEWKDVGVCKTQSDEAPDARERNVILKCGIPDAGHPVVIVVHE